MKKKLVYKKFIYFIAILMILVQASSCSFAQSSSSIKVAIRKYKMGNYTGCLQDCQTIIKRNPSSSIAYYYMAISYVQAGKQDEAIKAYSKVLSLKPNAKLAEYATTGKRCLETPDKCHLDAAVDPNANLDLDKLIASPSYESPAARKEINQKHLDNIKNQINGGKELDDYAFDKLHKTQADTNNLLASKPTDDEINNALKTLKEAGITEPMTTNPYAQMSNYQNPEMAQLNMLTGDNGQPKDNNAMLNMLPFMLLQNKNGTSNYSPQMMQAVIMNSMMPDFNYNLDKDK